MKIKKRKILSTFLLALLAMAVSYFCTNLDVSISGEKDLLKYWNALMTYLAGGNRNEVPENALFINVGSDKQLVEIKEAHGKHIGNDAITDRSKLYDLLSLIKLSGNYSYVILDVFFEEWYATETDSALFSLITSMDRIVIPKHADGKLIDSSLETKAAYADYATSLKEDNFAKFPLLDKKGAESMPLKVYHDLTGRTVTKRGLLYMDKTSVSRRVIFPKMYAQIDSAYTVSGDPTYYHMGVDFINLSKAFGDEHLFLDKIGCRFQDKIIVIGSFTGDVHTTYAGNIAGCVINYNVLVSLLKGQHKIPLPLILVYFLIFLAMSYLLLGDSSKQSQSLAWIWAKLFLLYSVILSVVCILVFSIWGQAHDIFITSTLFSVIDACHKKLSIIDSHA